MKRTWRKAFNQLTAFQGSSSDDFPHFSLIFQILVVHVIMLTNVFLFSYSTPTGVETPDVIDLRKQQRKEPEKPLYQVRHFQLCCFDIYLNVNLLTFSLDTICRFLKKRKKELLLGPYLEQLTRMYCYCLLSLLLMQTLEP